MPGSRDLSVENLRLHDHLQNTEHHAKHVVKTATSISKPEGSVRPPPKPESVPLSKAPSKAASDAGTSKSHKGKEYLEIVVIEEEEEEEEDDDDKGEKLPPQAPSVVSSAKPSFKAASVRSAAVSHRSHQSQYVRYSEREYERICAGYMPPPPPPPPLPETDLIPRMPAMPDMPMSAENREMALMPLPLPPPPPRSVAASAASRQVARRYPASATSQHSYRSKSRAGYEDEGELIDVVVEEVREVTRRRFVVKMPANRFGG